MGNYKFIDLFAGIGGFHIAFKSLGCECVFASEIDPFARKTYELNFASESPSIFQKGNYNRDIRSVVPSEMPDFDILCAGFPCQPFSQAGLKKGFEDNYKSERGNLFFYIAEILKEKKPKAFFLENVRGLLNHDDGRTFKVIQMILEEELGYSFYYKIINACDYGLPQLRPRLFMIGFRDENFLKSFQFPQKVPLKYTMSDVFEGNCERDIGYTLRVGGRGSKINDRRNWEYYVVNDEVKRISVKEAKKMQGFPDEFIFPVSEVQAMKQLGNSVAVDAIQHVAKSMINHLDNNIIEIPKENMKATKNKGEWSELLVFLKCILDKKIYFGDEELNSKDISFEVCKVTNNSLLNDYLLTDTSIVTIRNKITKDKYNIDIKTFLNDKVIEILKDEISIGKKTFDIPAFHLIQSELGIEMFKKANSNQKSDINIDIKMDSVYRDEGFGIKSYLGGKPTLLNASGNTNFIFKILNFDKQFINEVNEINTSQKLKDRIEKIFELGGDLEYVGAEKEVMEFNLRMVDSALPQLIGQALIQFYMYRKSTIKEIVQEISVGKTEDERKIIENIFKKLLVAVLLGFFAGREWNGEFESNGIIVLKSSGDMLGYHITRLEDLKNYLYNMVKLDTPSLTRHMFGNLYFEQDGNLYFKLNLQLRF